MTPTLKTRKSLAVDNQSTGAAVAQYRIASGITQSQLAAALKTTTSVVSENESGHPRRPWTEAKFNLYVAAINQIREAK